MQSLGAILLAAILAAAAGMAALVGAAAGTDPGRVPVRAEAADPTSKDRRSVHPAFGPPSPRLPEG